MKKSDVVGLAGVFLLALAIAWWWRAAQPAARDTVPARDPARAPGRRPSAGNVAAGSPAEPGPRARPPEPAASGLSAEEKAARVEKIKRDYDEIRTKASADYSAAGASFPGGLNAFLRQLALLEREKRADLAAVLTPGELEDLELRETSAGQLVQRWLGDTAAVEAQRRTVFRLQRAFEDRFALTFDVAPQALLERETARQELQEQIHAVLGDELFGSWLRGEGGDYARIATFAARQGLPAQTALEVWRAKNDYTLRRLELATNRGMPADQLRAAQAVLTQQTEARVMAIIGPSALQSGRNDVLGWLPKR